MSVPIRMNLLIRDKRCICISSEESAYVLCMCVAEQGEEEVGASTASTKSWKEAEESRTGEIACIQLHKIVQKSCLRCMAAS